VIVGAGISGLALAYRLSRLAPSVDLTVVERASRPGGTVWTERLNGFQIEIGPNGFLDTKPSTLELCRDLGLGNRLVPATQAASRRSFGRCVGDRHSCGRFALAQYSRRISSPGCLGGAIRQCDEGNGPGGPSATSGGSRARPDTSA